MPDFSAHRKARPLTGSNLSVKHERMETREEIKPTKPKGDDRLKKRRDIREEVMAEYKFRMKPIAGIAAARG